jgi:hypothetical protein
MVDSRYHRFHSQVQLHRHVSIQGAGGRSGSSLTCGDRKSGFGDGWATGWDGYACGAGSSAGMRRCR